MKHDFYVHEVNGIHGLLLLLLKFLFVIFSGLIKNSTDIISILSGFYAMPSMNAVDDIRRPQICERCMYCVLSLPEALGRPLKVSPDSSLDLPL